MSSLAFTLACMGTPSEPTSAVKFWCDCSESVYRG